MFAVECRCMHMDRERGKGRGGGGGEGESMRDLGKRRRHGGWVGDQTDSNWCCCLRSLS